MSFKKLLMATLAATAPLAGAVTITRHDVLECKVKSGGTFVLRAKYKWEPLAELMPRDVRTRDYDDGGFRVRYVDERGHRSAEAPNGIGYRGGLRDSNAASYCRDVGFLGGLPIVGHNFLLADGTWFAIGPERWPEKLSLSDSPREQAEPYKSQLASRMLRPHASTIVPVGDQLAFENSLVDVDPQHKRKDGDRNITAVFQSFSSDNGKTWSDPVITTDAKIFELGKALGEQSWVGYPSRVNGKRFKAKRAESSAADCATVCDKPKQ